ncbi:MAG TPA: hypothetical protein VMU20_12400 [Candidatus Dormibacteraeota bacterium]|nr:hypothetical protein [Candidatus Dormibacteraeota bacterium]
MSTVWGSSRSSIICAASASVIIPAEMNIGLVSHRGGVVTDL